MKRIINYNSYFYTILLSLCAVLLYIANTLSISYKEALNVFVNTSVLSYITNISIYLFGQNDIALRLPFLVFYLLSILLMYKLTQNYFRYEKDRFIAILIFMILPGVLSASILVNSSILVLFLVLLYIYVYEKTKKHSYTLLFIYLFADNSFAILYLAIFFYSLKKKDILNMVIPLILFIVSMYIYGFETSGKPKGYLFDTIAIYSSIFSPLIFFYFIYSIYRIGIKKHKTLIWYISTTALFLSFLLSFRQRIYIEDFAPYVVVSLPFVLKSFFNSYRVRLKQFRKKHDIAIMLTLLLLGLNVIFTIFNKPIYILLPNATKHLAYKYHFAKEIAHELKKRGISSVMSSNKELLLRLKYYGINSGKKYLLSVYKYKNYNDKIEISYYGKKLVVLYIVKLR